MQFWTQLLLKVPKAGRFWASGKKHQEMPSFEVQRDGLH
jgi:hypothetical protein